MDLPGPSRRTTGQRRAFFYGCLAYHKRGATICANGLVKPVESIDAALETTFLSNVLKPAILKAILDGARLKQTEERRRRLLQQREAIPVGLSRDRFDWRFLEREARQILAGWRTLATRHVTEARELLAALLHGPIMFTPFHEETSRGYQFHGQLEIGRMLNGVIDVVRGICTPGSTALRLASPPGFEPGFQP